MNGQSELIESGFWEDTLLSKTLPAAAAAAAAARGLKADASQEINMEGNSFSLRGL